MSERADTGHRGVVHTADLRVEAWAPTREQCVTEAVSAMVECVLGTAPPPPSSTVDREVSGDTDTDTDLLVAVLDEVIYLMDTRGQLPVAAEARPAPCGLRVRFLMVDTDTLTPVGAIPKAVSLHGLRCEHGPDGWWCSVTIDV